MVFASSCAPGKTLYFLSRHNGHSSCGYSVSLAVRGAQNIYCSGFYLKRFKPSTQRKEIPAGAHVRSSVSVRGPRCYECGKASKQATQRKAKIGAKTRAVMLRYCMLKSARGRNRRADGNNHRDRRTGGGTMRAVPLLVLLTKGGTRLPGPSDSPKPSDDRPRTLQSRFSSAPPLPTPCAPRA